MWKPLALVAAVTALAVTPFAWAQQQGNPTPIPESTQPTPPKPCTPLKRLYSWRNWRDAHPLRGESPCLPNPNRRRLRDFFRLYRHYRQIAPYRCHGGKEGYYAIPCYIVACESHFNWWAMNPSGASYVYQLLGWGAPAPSTFRNRVRNHEIAASLSLSNWACA